LQALAIQEPAPSRLPFGSTVYQRLHERLRDEILDGTLPPGLRLKITEIAARYGLSQMPVREALQQLQGEGLVVLSPNRGAAVRRVDARFIGHLFAIRAALDGMLTEEAAPLIDAATLTRLRQAQCAFDTAAHAGNQAACALLNHEFHRIILAVPGNDEALRLLEAHAGLIRAIRIRFGYRPGRLDAVMRDHALLLEALEVGDGARARQIAVTHMQTARDDLVAALVAEEANP
jgi:DNA-binding GntR family transcriptional regulator